jgi:hypothetical protein
MILIVSMLTATARNGKIPTATDARTFWFFRMSRKRLSAGLSRNPPSNPQQAGGRKRPPALLKMILISQIKFPLGQIVITPNALEKLASDEILNALDRHVQGDWGDLDKDDKLENDIALEKGFRILSAYTGNDGIKFWIMTESSRAVTTVLLPEDY